MNFFLVAAAFLTAAYVNAEQSSHPVVATGVGLLGAWISLIFYAFEVRIRELIHAGERALSHAEERLAASTGVAQLNICEAVKKPRFRFTAYSSVIRGLYGLTGVAFFSGSLYAFGSTCPDWLRRLVSAVCH